MIAVSNAARVVFPALGRTKGDVVAYYDRIASKMLPHVVGRPLSIKRFPKGLAGEGFFQKNIPAHYPPSFGRFEVPRSRAATKKHAEGAKEVTTYPVVAEAGHLPYLANQGALELHVPLMRADGRTDRMLLDLDPPPGEPALVQRAALLVREAFGELGLETRPVATGSKGYHVVAPIEPTAETHGVTMQKLGALLAAKHPDVLTTEFRIAARGKRVFIDWMRNGPMATVVAPYSLRARPQATVATPLAWEEIGVAPDAFALDDLDALLARHDSLSAVVAGDGARFARRVDEAFERSGLVVEVFDRFGRGRGSK